MDILKLPDKLLLPVILALTLASAPLFVWLPAWLAPLALAIGLYRWRASRMVWREPGKGLRYILAGSIVAGVYASYGTINGREPGATLLVGMAVLKLMETRSRRDAVILLFLSYFCAATTFLFAQSGPLSLYLFVVVLTTTTVLIQITQNSEYLIPWRIALAESGKMVAQALPMMVILFFLFPRLSAPLWGVPNMSNRGYTGLSDIMSPGSVSELIPTQTVAFRVHFPITPAPEKRDLYWRGPVLWQYDGKTWTAGTTPRDQTYTETAARELTSAPVKYEVILEPHGERWLLALDIPIQADYPQTSVLDDSLIARAPITERIRYRATSVTGQRRQAVLPRSTKSQALQLPSHMNPRTLALAKQWASQEPNPQAVIRRALTWFHDQPYHYTLSPPTLGTQGVDDFMFETRKGFCEHYAGAFTYLMRAAGIPARVVTGYQGGERNPFGDYLIIRQSDAHAWTEVWIDGTGWQRVDPTAFIDPSRVDNGLLGFNEHPDRSLNFFDRVRLTWDATNYQWNRWVLGFNSEQQHKTLAKIGLPQLGLREQLLLMVGAMSIVLLILTFGSLWRRNEAAMDPAQRLYMVFCDRLASLGIVHLNHEGPQDFAARASALRPDLAAHIQQFVKIYVRTRYARSRGTNDPDALSVMRATLRSLSSLAWRKRIAPTYAAPPTNTPRTP